MLIGLVWQSLLQVDDRVYDYQYNDGDEETCPELADVPLSFAELIVAVLATLGRHDPALLEWVLAMVLETSVSTKHNILTYLYIIAELTEKQ